MLVKGIDVSYCQKGFDYARAVKAGVRFAIIRAGFSETADSQLENHIAQCEKYGIDYGFYWYSYAMSVEEAKREAAVCLRTLAGRTPVYPVFYDMEEGEQAKKLSRATLTDMAIAFCDAINAGGLPCGIYANPSWLENYYDKSRLVGKYDIWLAHWTESPDRPSRCDYGQTMWQWGIDDIGMEVDGDICFVDYPSRTSEWYAKRGIIKSPAVPQTDTPAYKKGDTVMLKKGAKFTNNVTPYSWVYGTAFTVYGTANAGKELMIGLGGEITGWIYAADAIAVKTTTPAVESKLSAGDKVRVKSGANAYHGEKLAPFVYDNTYTVMQVGTAKNPDYVVIGINGQVTAAVKSEDLIIA